MSLRRCLIVAALPLLLGGCLLPQPDTPPVPPGLKGTGSSRVGTPLLPPPDTPPVAIAPGSASGAGLLPQSDTPPINPGVVPNAETAGGAKNTAQPTSAIAPTASASTSAAADAGFSAPSGQLDGKFTGLPVSQASVVDESGQTVFQVTPVGSDGAFAFTLAPGRYQLVITTDDGRRRIGEVFTVEAGKTHTYTITLTTAPAGATVSEETTLVDEGATGS